MSVTLTISRVLALSLAGASGLVLAGCQSPTYGTGTRADVQLMEDVTNAIALAPPKREKIAYNPRPELVKPADKSALPPPQTDVVAGNAAWPESPEQVRARIRAEADANAGNPNFRPQIDPSTGDESVANAVPKKPVGSTVGRRAERIDQEGGNFSGTGSTGFKKNPLRIFAGKEAKREEINASLAQQEQKPPSRRYLSDPPVEYQDAAATAPVNDIGEDEKTKEARRKKLLKANDKKSWRDWLPF